MSDNPYPSYPPPLPQRRRIPVLKIIGTILLVMILICGGLVTYVAYNFRSWTAALIKGPAVTVVEQSNLPADQKTLIKQNLNRVADAYHDGRMSYTQFTTIISQLDKGPFFKLVSVESMRYQYSIAHPSMDAERAQTILLFDRFERGIAENAIPPHQVSQVMSLVHDPDRNHHRSGQTSRPAISEADLKPFIDAMRTAVEQAEIPAVAYQADFAGEIDKAVNTVLGPPPTTRATQSAPATQAATAEG